MGQGFLQRPCALTYEMPVGSSCSFDEQLQRQWHFAHEAKLEQDGALWEPASPFRRLANRHPPSGRLQDHQARTLQLGQLAPQRRARHPSLCPKVLCLRSVGIVPIGDRFLGLAFVWYTDDVAIMYPP
jgi:hypothetical protein